MPLNKLRRRRSLIAAVACTVLTFVSCTSVTESILDVDDPDLITPESVNSAEGALSLRTGALNRLRTMTGGGESTWLFGGLLVDEWSTSSTFVQNDETDERSV
jgi:hypothetical protein